MTKQKMTNLIGAGTLATIMLIIFLAFGSFNNGIAVGDGGGNNVFASLVSNFGEGEEGEDEGEEMEEDEMGEMAGMGEENEMEDEGEDEDD